MAKRIGNDRFKGIKAITPYQRIAERYGPVPERSQQDADNRPAATERPTRRFIALRNLIDNLKQNHTIERIDYISAEKEIRALGWEVINKNLPPLLSDLGLSDKATKVIINRVDDHAPLLQLSYKSSIDQLDRLIYPEVDQGLQVLNLAMRDLSLPIIDSSCVALVKQCKNGPIVAALNNLYLTFSYPNKKKPHSPPKKSFQLTLSISSGVIEIDTTGRRAFLYQRADKSFALYADKRINLEI